jgi:hypothetical protein
MFLAPIFQMTMQCVDHKEQNKMAAQYLSKSTSHFITQSERCVPDFFTLIYPLAASNVATSGPDR